MIKENRQAFTLVELLVVISIIALLAGLALPAMNGARVQGLKIQDTSNLRNIGTIIKIYANDNEGSYPSGLDGSGNRLSSKPSDSNIAYRELFQSGHLKDERIFFTPGAPMFKKPDGDFGKAPSYTEALQDGENPYTYFWGQSDSSEPQDLLASNPTTGGFAPSADGWTVSSFHPRIWSGSGINVLYCDSSVRWVPKKSSANTTVSNTDQEASSGQLLNPKL